MVNDGERSITAFLTERSSAMGGKTFLVALLNVFFVPRIKARSSPRRL
jgi:hypothetical protein